MESKIQKMREKATLSAIGVVKEIFASRGAEASFKKLNKKHALANGIIRPFDIRISTEEIEEEVGRFPWGVAVSSKKKIIMREDLGTEGIHTYFHEARHNFQKHMQKHIFSRFANAFLTDYEKVIVAYNYLRDYTSPSFPEVFDRLTDASAKINYLCDPLEIDARIYALDMIYKCFKNENGSNKDALYYMLGGNLKSESGIKASLRDARIDLAFKNELYLLPKSDIMFTRIMREANLMRELFEHYNVADKAPLMLAIKMIEKNMDGAKREFAGNIRHLKRAFNNLRLNEDLPEY